MKKYRFKKRAISVLLAVLVAFTGLVPAGTAMAADGVEGIYEIQLFYKDTDTMVPTYIDETAAEKQEYIEYMVEGEELNLTYKLIGTEMPNNGYIKWYSETPSLVDVTQEGVVKAFDSSKGAVIQSWIDNEVKTIPLIGSLMGSALEKVFFNEYVDVDTMDTDEIIQLVEDAFGSDSLLAQWVDSYKGELIDSLRYYLDNINSNIHVQLFDADGTLLADDYVQICVTKNEEWYANFLPNGTHITNKSQIDTTVAVGSTVQLYAVTTPLRLHYNCIYSVKSTSIFEQGKVVATVNDSGLVTFKNTGTVTIIVSPDTEEIIQGILELVNYFYALENTGTLDTDQIAGILIDYVGLDMNRTVLAGILDVCFAISDIVGDTADPVQLTATAIELISNLVLQFVYNDTITFTVVDGQPITDFSIDGATTVKEGSQIQMSIVDIQPSAGDTSDITWTSSDPSVASVDPKTGVITGRDAGGSLGSISTQQCTITATSAANKVSKSVTVTVTGKTGRYLSDVEIIGESELDAPAETDYTYQIYPARVAESDNLYIEWGIVNGTDEEGNTAYLWATEDTPAENGIGKIDSNGHYTAVGGGICEIAIKAYTGYPIGSDNFYEISSLIKTFKVTNGIPIESITINATGATSNGKLNRVETVNINGQDYTYATIHKSIAEAYSGNGAKLSASIYPETASNKELKWVVDNTYYNTEVAGDTLSCEVTQKAGHEVADTFNVYAVSEDGKVKSNVITVCVTRNYATSNTIDQESIELTYGTTTPATHTVTFDGSWDSTAYACFKCNWYSSDENVFTVAPQGNDNRDATITAVDVGTATLYCVSADGGIVDSVQVTVYPDKDYLERIVKLCNSTIVRRTPENADLYKTYSKKLDLAYYVLFSEPLASQTSCDTTARELLFAFYNIGGFVGITGVDILDTGKKPLASDHISVKVDSLNYKDASYDLDYKVTPSNAMYNDVTWTSSNSSIIVDDNGVCRPADNDPCSAIITCTVKDYMGIEISGSVYIAFVKEQATGVTLNTSEIVGGKIGESQQLSATVEPDKLVGGASCTDVHWASSDESIATVDANGVVTFVAGGDCIIYCITYDGGKVAECKVNVVTNYSNLQLLIQQYTDLQLQSVNYYPDSWNNYTAVMSEAQAMVSTQGYSQREVDDMYTKLQNAYNSLEKYNYLQKVELYLDGEATSDFYQYDLSLLSEGLSYKNAILDLNVRLYPNNASYASVKWESSTSDIAVSEDGKCTPTSNKYCYGRITCTVTDHYGNSFSDDVWVSYSYIPVTAIELSEESIFGVIGETYQLYASVKPDGLLGANIKEYFWESLDENIATVDETGLVTFKGAGATTVRAVSYDGGIYGECLVSSGGDRTELKKALDNYKDVDYTQYEYDYGMAFKKAYEEAESILTNDTCSQEYIDVKTDTLIALYNSMIAHPYINIETINLNYQTKKRDLIDRETNVASGSISSTDCLSIDLSNNYANYNNYNDLYITPQLAPSGAMYKSYSWSVDASNKMKSSTDGATIKFTPDDRDNGAWAVATITYTNHYDVVTKRTICIVMSENTVKSFDLPESTKELYATASPVQISYNISGGEFPTIFWVSSDTNVATVNENGVVTPVDKGQAVITAKTLDGGFSDSITVSVITDFSALAAKQTEYYNLIEQVTDTYTYTEASLEKLSLAVSKAKEMIDKQSATQAEVNAMITELDDAYNSLQEYVFATGITVNVDGQDGVSITNDKYIRMESNIFYNKTINLNPKPYPENAVYTSMEFTSSNSNIEVDENGVVTSKLINAGYTVITCAITNAKGETYESSYYVTFTRYAVTGISFNDDIIYGSATQTATLSPVITNSADSSTSLSVVNDCIYESDNEEVATVDNKGVVTFVSHGEATITATTVDGGFTASTKVYTTWDTTALQAAIAAAELIDYTDYEYNSGMAFKNAYDNAVSVYADVFAEQSVIDDACTALVEATTTILESPKFVSPIITILQNGETVDESKPILVDENNQVILDYSLNEGAMVKSTEWECQCDDNTVFSINENNQLVITKNSEGDAAVTVTVHATDDYDRVVTKTIQIKIIDGLVNATAITLTANGTAIDSSTYSVENCGISYSNLDLKIGYITTPENANAVTSVKYTSSESTYVTVTDDGVIELTTRGKIRSSNTSTITCTVTNSDGTTASASVTVTLSR